MEICKRTTIVFIAIMLGACGSSTQIIRPAASGTIKVDGLNVLYVNNPLTSSAKKSADVRDYAPASPDRDLLRDTVVKVLAERIKEKGIPVSASSVEFIPGIAPAPMHSHFPTDSMDRHTLVVSLLSGYTTCHFARCATQYKVSMSLRSPQTNKELWQVQIEQPLLVNTLQYESKYYEFVDTMASALFTTVAYKVEKPGVN